MGDAFDRAWGSIRDDADYMVASSGPDLEWLVEQLARWPERAHSEKTTNIRFLMQSAAATIMEMHQPSAPLRAGKQGEE